MQKQICEKVKKIFEEIFKAKNEFDSVFGKEITIKDISREDYEKYILTKKKFLKVFNKFETNADKITDETEIFLGSIKIAETSWTEMPANLTMILKDVDFKDSEVTDLGRLTIIGGDANFKYSKIEDLKLLESIGGNADFRRTNMKSLGVLKSVGNMMLRDFGNELDFSGVECEESRVI